MLRTHTNGQLSKSEVGQTVTLCGWVHARRDHGGIIFIDLRDRYGLTQIKFDPNIAGPAMESADQVRSEWVIKVTGEVLARPREMVNSKMVTGEIEVSGLEIEILSKAKTPPFEIGGDVEVNEELRLKYRYLDLRNPKLQEIMKNRDLFITHVREYFHKQNFVEVATPILANSSPEGARDFLVPSRIHPGKFYALPQAPQQFKQLLMVAGLDRYFQIAPCFRDEDPRADRHPGDFYQIDLEMSFVEQEDVWNLVEPLMIELTKKFSDKEVISAPFPRITYNEAISKYGSDKPDLRFGFEITEVTEIFKNSEFKVFKEAINSHGIVSAMKVDGGGKFSRSEIDALTEIAKEKGAKGLAYIVYEDELKSPILKFMSPEEIEGITKATGAKKGDIVFFGADNFRTASLSLGAVRNECGKKLGLKDPKKAAWLWVIDFPMYEMNDQGKMDFAHNPFSMPKGGMESLENIPPLEISANQYDLVCNGFEISSGAIRNHRPEIMYKAFEIVGYDKEVVDQKFGHMIKAFEYGAPPHGGIAPGLDRLLMVLWELPSIRDIYAFPKNGNAQDLMLGSPSEVDEKQLKDLHIKLDIAKK